MSNRTFFPYGDLVMTAGAEFSFLKLQLIGEIRCMWIVASATFLIRYRTMHCCGCHLRFEVVMAFKAQISWFCLQELRMTRGVWIVALRAFARLNRSMNALALHCLTDIIMALEAYSRFIDRDLLRKAAKG
jgi:hypothetical protein